jgi:hypothetical protein
LSEIKFISWVLKGPLQSGIDKDGCCLPDEMISLVNRFLKRGSWSVDPNKIHKLKNIIVGLLKVRFQLPGGLI